MEYFFLSEHLTQMTVYTFASEDFPNSKTPSLQTRLQHQVTRVIWSSTVIKLIWSSTDVKVDTSLCFAVENLCVRGNSKMVGSTCAVASCKNN